MSNYIIRLSDEPTAEDPNPLVLYIKEVNSKLLVTTFLADALKFDSVEEAEKASASYRDLWDIDIFSVKESIHPTNARIEENNHE